MDFYQYKCFYFHKMIISSSVNLSLKCVDLLLVLWKWNILYRTKLAFVFCKHNGDCKWNSRQKHPQNPLVLAKWWKQHLIMMIQAFFPIRVCSVIMHVQKRQMLLLSFTSLLSSLQFVWNKMHLMFWSQHLASFQCSSFHSGILLG